MFKRFFRKSKHRKGIPALELISVIKQPVNLCKVVPVTKPRFQHGTNGWIYCTYCGESFDSFAGKHVCIPYGRHARKDNESQYVMMAYGKVFARVGNSWEKMQRDSTKLKYLNDDVITLPNKSPKLIKTGTEQKNLLLTGQLV